MLGKLLKHDFKATGKVMLPLNLILIAITALGCLLIGSNLLQRTELLPITTILLIAYVLMLITLTTITSIYLIVHFYRTMFTAQGYLTFTLPTSAWSLLHSKTIVGFVWMALNSLLTLLCTFLLVGAFSRFQINPGDVTEFFTTTTMNLNGTPMNISMSIWDILGYSPAVTLLLFILLLLTSWFYSISTGYGCVAIGQLYARHKVVGTVLALVGNYLLAQLIVGGVMISAALKAVIGIASNTTFAAEDMVGIMQSIYKPIFPTLIIVYLVLGIAGYLAAGIIMKKKVNLD